MDAQTSQNISNDSLEARNPALRTAAADYLVLAGLASVALLLAWPTLHCGVWLDEILSLHSATAPDLPAVLKSAFARQDDYHPPLGYMVIHCIVAVFGTNDIVIKLPALICGLATIPALYWLGKTAHSARVGLMAAFFFVVSPFANYFSCQCRAYAIALLLTTVAITFFYKLLEDRNSRKKVAFAGVALSTAALCYTEYVGCILIPILGLSSAIICARKYLNAQEKTAKDAAVKNFVRSVGALFIGLLLFAPWIRSLLLQMDGASYPDKPALTRLPEVASYALMNMLPLPVILGFYFSAVLLAVLIGRIIWRRIRENSQTPSKPLHSAISDSYIILLCTTFISSAVMPYLTSFWNNYYRYIYPYSASTWVLLAAIFSSLFWDKREQISTRSKVALATTLFCLAALNVAYIFWFDQRPNSGFYTIAKEIKAGKFDDAALVITPDVLGPTLDFYISEQEAKKHNLGVFGFPRWNETRIPAIIPDMAKQWAPETLVAEYEQKIADLPAKGFKHLAFAKDSDKQIQMLSTRRMPRKKRVDALMAVLNSKYKLISTTRYPGASEDITVLLYEF
ncbi:MAG: glycosyltransferase family 39 protein [Candidatus Melainabacteria bacterium]|nr:glycosyltransferase family 39 protein [Candidatus Melainabacteria bacterium]